MFFFHDFNPFICVHCVKYLTKVFDNVLFIAGPEENVFQKKKPDGICIKNDGNKKQHRTIGMS